MSKTRDCQNCWYYKTHGRSQVARARKAALQMRDVAEFNCAKTPSLAEQMRGFADMLDAMAGLLERSIEHRRESRRGKS